MNIEKAKAIPIAEFLNKLGFSPVREDNKDAYYRSPLRVERTASFHVNKKQNHWYDHGQGIGGDLIEFVRHYLTFQGFDNAVSDCLRYIGNMTGAGFPQIPDFELPDYSQDNKKLVKKSVSPIKNIGLIKYIESRGISLTVAKTQLKEVWVHNNSTGKDFCALGFRNEKGGYELRNPFFKGCLGRKGVTFIRGKVPKPSGIHVFEGGFDDLTFVQTRENFEHDEDIIVLHSLACLREGMAFIKGYGYSVAHTWFDNDSAGEKATAVFSEFCKMEDGLRHNVANELYQGHKDLNAWHMDNWDLTVPRATYEPA